ncbi:urease accessory protein UreD [Martelella endophytica]|uniref:Urease accessory protein UreD n=1 Tax=Martelella endophytica TaxID=1486262 RepID=A0A0D5LKN6_MAREN|nr:urease accessory protein UreD [Martelella endophytica]AJY44505.1 urease accessory protein UreD [Martelella endophytica]
MPMMPASPQRTFGRGEVKAKYSRGRTRLDELYQDGAAKIRIPESFDGRMEAVLINTSGGLTGGDRLQWVMAAEAGTALTVTTQACEKIYKSDSGPASIDTELRVEGSARLDWLPQETILFDDASLNRRLDVDLAEDAEFLAIEAVLLGRKAMGEAVRYGNFRDRWRVRRSGTLIHAEDVRMTGDIENLVAQTAVLGGDVAFATLLYFGPRAEALMPKVREALGTAAAGASEWNGKLVARIVAADGYALRKSLIPALRVLRDGENLPKVWHL